MSEFKGTPGGWEREGLTVYALDERLQVNRFSCRVDSGYQIKSPFQARLTSREELDANARLIAAAPDLLEALEALMNIETADVDMDEFDDSDSVGAYQDENGAVKDLPLTFGHLRRARAAIAKALGQ